MADVPASPTEGQQGEQPTQPTQAAPEVTAQPPSQSATPGQVPVQNAEGQAGAGLQMPSILQKAANQPPVTSEEKLWGLVSYVPLVGLIALVIKPDSAYIRLHGRQGVLLFAIFFFSIFVYLLPFVGALIGALIHIAVIALGIFSMYQAFIGNWWKIPVIGDIAEQIPVEAFTKVTREAVMGPGKAEPETPVQTPVDEGVQAEQVPPQEAATPEPSGEKTTQVADVPPAESVKTADVPSQPEAEKTPEQPPQSSGDNPPPVDKPQS